VVVQSPSSPLNVLVVLVDDLGWSDLACYGADLHETPAFDAFARSAVRFTHAYAAAPVCSPTRAALLTGKHPARLHMTTWFESSTKPPLDRPLIPPATVGNLPLSEITLAERLRGGGYFTAHVGKWHLGDAAHYPEVQGFDVNIAGTFWGAPATHFFPYSGPFGDAGEMRYVPGLAFGEPGEHLADRLTDEAIRILERVRDRPFFLSLWHYSVHTPIEAPPALVDRFKSKIKPGLGRQHAEYAAMVAHLDAAFGRLMAALDDLGLADRTLVVVASDNGGYVSLYRGRPVTTNAPLRSGKGSLYEGGVRVPLLVRWPGRSSPGAESAAPVVTMDLFPTILQVALPAEPAPEGLDGDSIAPLLLGRRAPQFENRSLFFHFPHYYPTTTPVSAVRRGPWKLLEYLEDGRIELYNLDEDPLESTNLADARPETAAELLAQLQRWRVDVGAPMPSRRGD
jgi:arylsulfatase A-like enzyme